MERPSETRLHEIMSDFYGSIADDDPYDVIRDLVGEVEALQVEQKQHATYMQAVERLEAAAQMQDDYDFLHYRDFDAKYPEYQSTKDSLGLAWDADNFIRAKLIDALAAVRAAKGEESEG